MNEYSKKIHNNSAELAREITTIISENLDMFIPMIGDESPEEIKKQEEFNADFGNRIIGIIAQKDLPVGYATFALEKILDNVEGLKKFISGTIGSYHSEYISRSLGIKNEEGKYRSESATLGQLLLKLNEVKESTGNNPWDFYNEVAPTFPDDGTEVK